MDQTNLSCTKNEEEEWIKQYQELLQTLPKEKYFDGATILYNYEGLWYSDIALKGLLFIQKHYKPHKSDIIIASSPKSGTTWLKALVFTIVNRSRYSLIDHPLLKTGTHELVPFFDFGLCLKDQFPDLDLFPQPRIFATHASYASLPCSVKNANKIVYVCRNPLDLFISLWHFIHYFPGIDKELITPLEEAFEAFSRGINNFGPIWDQISGYFKASIERPDKVLFLKYEDMKANSVLHVKKLANFLGFSFSEEEEKQGLIEEIAKFCSFESMKNFEVNKSGVDVGGVVNAAFFRKGEVGDSLNYLSPAMVERLEKVTKEKLGDLGLHFELPG